MVIKADCISISNIHTLLPKKDKDCLYTEIKKIDPDFFNQLGHLEKKITLAFSWGLISALCVGLSLIKRDKNWMVLGALSFGCSAWLSKPWLEQRNNLLLKVEKLFYFIFRDYCNLGIKDDESCFIKVRIKKSMLNKVYFLFIRLYFSPFQGTERLKVGMTLQSEKVLSDKMRNNSQLVSGEDVISRVQQRRVKRSHVKLVYPTNNCSTEGKPIWFKAENGLMPDEGQFKDGMTEGYFFNNSTGKVMRFMAFKLYYNPCIREMVYLTSPDSENPTWSLETVLKDRIYLEVPEKYLSDMNSLISDLKANKNIIPYWYMKTNDQSVDDPFVKRLWTHLTNAPYVYDEFKDLQEAYYTSSLNI